MESTRMRLRAEWRRRRGALVAFMVLVAVAGAVVTVAFAGARRTQSVPERFMVEDGTADAFVALESFNSFDGVDEIRAQHDVERTGVSALMSVFPFAAGRDRYMPMMAATEPVAENDMWQGLLIEGRRADQSADEVMLAESHARALGVRAGDDLPLLVFDRDLAQECLLGEENTSNRCAEHFAAPQMSVKVAGIVRTAIDLNGEPDDVNLSLLTRGFFERHRDDIAWSPFVHVDLRPDAKRDAFAESMRAETLADVVSEVNFVNAAAITDAVDVLSAGLVLFGLVAALAAAFAIGQSVTRHVRSGIADRETLGVFGMTRRGRRFDAVAPILLAASAGSALAWLFAYLASGIMPIGLAHRAEVSPGRDLDLAVFALVFGVTIVFVTAIAMISASHRITRTARAGRASLAARAAGAPVAPSVAVAMRNALSGSQDAVPVRSGFGGVAAAAVGVVAVLVFAAGLHALVDTPRLYGWTWDVMDVDDQQRDALLNDPDIDAVALLQRRTQLQVGGHPTLGLAMTPVRGVVEAPIVSGRAPASDNEVALGRDTLRFADTDVGKKVTIASPAGTLDATVVGVAAFATDEDGDALADGVLLTPTALHALTGPADLDRDFLGQQGYAATLRPGVDREAAFDRLDARLGDPVEGTRAFSAPSPPAEVTKLRQVESLPYVLAGFLSVLGVIAMFHTMFIGTRRRARDFAVLRALGFRPRDVGTSVLYEAGLVVSAAVLVGLPLGVVLGRFAWTRVADGIGVLVVSRVPLVVTLAAVPVAVVCAFLIALVPARRAARILPAVVLRAE